MPARYALLFCLLFQAAVSTGQYLRTVNIPAYDIAYSSLTNRVYVAKYQSNTENLCVVNPQTGDIDTCYSFPGTPFAVAVSEDQTYLYAGFGVPYNPGRIVQIALATGQIVMNAALATNTIPSRLVPVPGLPNSVVARIQFYQPNSTPEFTAVYDSGVQRPLTSIYPEEIVFTNDPTKLIGIYDGDFVKFDLTPEGLVKGDLWDTHNSEPGMKLYHFGNYIITTTGARYDISTGNPIYDSFYFNEPFKQGGPCAYDESNGQIYFALSHQPDPYAATINAYPLEGNHLPEKFGHPALVSGSFKLISCGGGGKLALASLFDDKFYLINPCTSTDPAPLISPETTGTCYGDTVELAATPGYTGYLWSTGDNTASILTTQTSGYWLKAIGEDGCLTVSSDSVMVYFDEPPPLSGYEPGGIVSSFCEGDSLVLEAFIPNTFVEYDLLWSTGDTTATITIDTAGEYLISLVSEHGCMTPASYSKIIELLPLPEQPKIVMVNDTTLGTTATNVFYQWLRDGLPLPFGNGSTIALDTPGVYSLIVTSFDGCVSDESEPYNFDFIPVFPNPATTVISIWNDNYAQMGSYQILNLFGQVVQSGVLNGHTISIAGLNAGQYFIFWFNKDGVKTWTSTFLKIS